MENRDEPIPKINVSTTKLVPALDEKLNFSILQVVNPLTGFYMRATLVFNGLISEFYSPNQGKLGWLLC